MSGAEGDPVSIARLGGLDQEKDRVSEVALQLNQHILSTFTAEYCPRLLGRHIDEKDLQPIFLWLTNWR